MEFTGAQAAKLFEENVEILNRSRDRIDNYARFHGSIVDLCLNSRSFQSQGARFSLRFADLGQILGAHRAWLTRIPNRLMANRMLRMDSASPAPRSFASLRISRAARYATLVTSSRFPVFMARRFYSPSRAIRARFSLIGTSIGQQSLPKQRQWTDKFISVCAARAGSKKRARQSRRW